MLSSINVGEEERGSYSNERPCVAEGDGSNEPDGDAQLHMGPMHCWRIYSATLRMQRWAADAGGRLLA